jgi:hypothetical protein
MRTIRFLLQKEFRQIFRNKIILAMIIVMPAVQLMILPLAADYEVKNINIAVVDHDHSPYSRQLVSVITGSGYFKRTGYSPFIQRSVSFAGRGQSRSYTRDSPPLLKRMLFVKMKGNFLLR